MEHEHRNASPHNDHDIDVLETDGTLNATNSGISSNRDDFDQSSTSDSLADVESITAALGQRPTSIATVDAPILQNTTDDGSISVSTTFPPVPVFVHDLAQAPDVIVQSSDHVFFGVHRDKLLAASRNRFCYRLPAAVESRQATSEANAPYILMLPDSSHVLNVVLHAMYGRSCTDYSPSFDVLSAAVTALKTYAIPLAPHLARNTPLYTLIIGQAQLPGFALEAFALAAENQLEDLAVAISPYVLSVEANDIPDTLARRIGGVYMRRICALSERRLTSMRSLVVTPPYSHPPNRQCTPSNRQDLGRAWMLAAAQLVWDLTPDTSPQGIRAVLNSLGSHVWCPECKESWVKRTDEVIVKWSLLDRTI